MPSKKPNTQPRVIHALAPWFPDNKGAKNGGQIVGKVTTDYGAHYVIEDESGERYRLPAHVDLDRKIQAVRLLESEPWIDIEYEGLEPEGNTKIYKVQHFPRT